MNALKLIHTLQENELKEFENYLDSPFSPGNGRLKSFFHTIKGLTNNGRGSKDMIWKKVYGESEPYRDTTFRRLSSDLYKALRQFLGIKKYLERFDGDFDFLKVMHGRNQDQLFEKEFKRIQSQLEKRKYKGEDYYRSLMNLELAGLSYAYRKPTREYGANLAGAFGALDRYYIIRRYKLALGLLNHHQMYKGGHSPDLEELPFHSNLLAQHLEDPVIYLFDLCYRLYLKGREATFIKIQNSLHAIDNATVSEKYELYSLVLNYAIRRANAGSSRYLERAFHLCRTLMKQKVFTHAGRLSPKRYKTVIRAGLALGKKRWVRQFIEEFKPFLAPSIREMYHGFALAAYDYNDHMHALALKRLHNITIDTKDVFFDLEVRMLRLRIYIETQDDRLDNELAALKMKTHRLKKKNLFSYQVQQMHHDILMVFTKLTNQKPDEDIQQLLNFASNLPAEFGRWVTAWCLGLRKRKAKQVL